MDIVVLVDENWAIGRAGDQFIRIKKDLQRFKKLTRGAIVIYGRKTLNTYPGAKILSERENWILTTNPDKKVPGATMIPDLATCLSMVKQAEQKGRKVFCLGGGSVYQELLPYTSYCYVTKVKKKYLGTDVFFPDLDKLSNWEITKTSPEYEAGREEIIKYNFVDYKNNKIREY